MENGDSPFVNDSLPLLLRQNEDMASLQQQLQITKVPMTEGVVAAKSLSQCCLDGDLDFCANGLNRYIVEVSERVYSSESNSWRAVTPCRHKGLQITLPGGVLVFA